LAALDTDHRVADLSLRNSSSRLYSTMNVAEAMRRPLGSSSRLTPTPDPSYADFKSGFFLEQAFDCNRQYGLVAASVSPENPNWFRVD